MPSSSYAGRKGKKGKQNANVLNSTPSDVSTTDSLLVPSTVKSKAIVKYSQVQMPVLFNRLAFNTNLNVPPTNFLAANTTPNEIPLDKTGYRTSGFDSFRMTHMFPDCVGEVDVISDAENIKKLLKLPYAKTTAISMTVHKIGNTLLLDEFDIHKYLLCHQNDDWNWLRRFILEDIIAYHGGIQKFALNELSFEAIESKNLFSKFLRHSQKPVARCGKITSAKSSASKAKAENEIQIEDTSTTATATTSTLKCPNAYKYNKNIRPLLSTPETPPCTVTNTGTISQKSTNNTNNTTSNNNDTNNTGIHTSEIKIPIKAPVLPEPKIEENIPDPTSSHAFQRNVVWTFEDIRMLIGTDMPIFGGPDRPCISLRLHDMAKPINVLTGIDYWLDNLMCNVPEVVMCYHLDGIVQKYEIVKTEDLPQMKNSQFSPELVRNVAQNILSFLKSNATKEGHTYWLFKDHNDEVAKLYDLTTICRESNEENFLNESASVNCNPFTISVGMLLYTVARNMKIRFNHSNHLTTKNAGYIKALLKNTIKLLPKEKYSQILASSHYLLSDLYVPVGTDPRIPIFQRSTKDQDDDDDDDDNDDEDDDENDGKDGNNSDYKNTKNISVNSNDNDSKNDTNYEISIAITNICETLKNCNIEEKSNRKINKSRPPPLIADTEERCYMALEEVYKGLLTLQYFNDNEQKFIKNTEICAKNEEMQRIMQEEKKTRRLKTNGKKNNTPVKQSKSKQNNNGNSSKITNGNNEKSMNLNTVNMTFIDWNTSNEPLTMVGKLHNRNQVIENFNTHHFGSWKTHLKLLLIEKACLTYTILAETHYNAERYGYCLKAIYLSYHCQQVMLKYMKNMISKKSCFLGRAGDYFYLMAKNWDNVDEYICQFHEISHIEESIVEELNKEYDINLDPYNLIKPMKNIEQLMMTSSMFYENAIDLIDKNSDNPETSATHTELLRRLGNVNNELGLKYMFWAQEEYMKASAVHSGLANIPLKTEEPLYFQLTVKSYDCLKSGINCFEAAHDVINTAFLYCNMGRFMRFRAYVDIPEPEASKFDVMKKHKCFYYEAFDMYEKGLHALGNRKFNPELWDLLFWELSTSIFALGQHLQDHIIINKVIPTEEMEKEIVQLLQRGLKVCDVQNMTPRRIHYIYRSGVINKRIAQLNFTMLHTQRSQNGILLKTTLQLCKHYYFKAAEIFTDMNETNDVIVVLLQHIELEEFLAENSNQVVNKIKHYQSALELCINSKYIFKNVNPKTFAAKEIQTQDIKIFHEKFPEEILIENMKTVETRLQAILRTLIKLFTNFKDHKNHIVLYKNMYMETLETTKQILANKEIIGNPCQLGKYYFALLQTLYQLDYKWECVDKYKMKIAHKNTKEVK